MKISDRKIPLNENHWEKEERQILIMLEQGLTPKQMSGNDTSALERIVSKMPKLSRMLKQVQA